MAISFVAVREGRRRIQPVGATLFLAVCLLCMVGLPAAIFWLVFGDMQLIRNTMVLGFVFACSTFGAILRRALTLPLAELPPDPSEL